MDSFDIRQIVQTAATEPPNPLKGMDTFTLLEAERNLKQILRFIRMQKIQNQFEADHWAHELPR